MSSTPDRIRWHEEMLITPQHLQQLSLRTESLVQGLPGRYQPFFWGVSSCDYRVNGGVITLRALDAVMPNGFHAAIDEERGQLHLDLGPIAAGLRSKPLLVHVAMPLGEPGAITSRRFVACEGEAANAILGEDGVEIPRLRTNLVLLTGETPPTSRYTSFPLLELQWEGSSWGVTDFMPPTLRIDPASRLGQQCASLSDRLRREAAVVADRLMDALQAPFSADVRAQLNPVIGALPAFEVLAAAQPHAAALYVELCRLAGAVAVLRNRLVPPQFPLYLHDNARPGFDHVMRFVLGASDQTLSATIRRFTFDREGAWFLLPPNPGWTEAVASGSRFRMVLGMEADTTDAQALKWGNNCVIATRGAVRSLLSRRVLGLTRRRVVAGAAFPAQGNLHLFQIVPDAEAATADEDLMVLGDVAGLKPAALYLFVVDGEEEYGDG